MGDVLAWIQNLAAVRDIRITEHAAVEMADEDLLLEDVLESIETAQVLENYPDHRRGACCLLFGTTREPRPLHVVCTTQGSPVVLITVYEPMLPKWRSPKERNR